MRLRAIACSCLLIAVSAGGVKTMAASPDCARWIKEYQNGLAKHAVLGKKHVTRAAHHLMRIKPRLQPSLTRVNAPLHKVRSPKLSPQEMLKRFKVLCGEDLPDDVMPAEFVPTSLEEAFIPPVETTDQPPLIDDGGGIPFVPTAGTPTATTPTATTPTNNPPTNGGTNGGFPVTPITPAIPITPVSPVPEPGTLVLLATGVAGMSLVVRRRKVAA